MGFFSKKPAPVQPAQTDKTMDELDLELKKLQILKQERMQRESTQAKIVADDKEKAKDTIQEVEKIYIKTLNDVQRIVDYCQEKGWVTKKDWDANNVPMKQMVTELLKIAVRYSGMTIDEFNQTMMQIVKERKDL